VKASAASSIEKLIKENSSNLHQQSRKLDAMQHDNEVLVSEVKKLRTMVMVSIVILFLVALKDFL
jgi:hypothetical protein